MNHLAFTISTLPKEGINLVLNQLERPCGIVKYYGENKDWPEDGK